MKHNYVAIGFDHFAKSDDVMALAKAQGMLQRNFQGYEVRNDDKPIPIIGVGISAISTMPDGYAQNCINIEDYTQAILLKKQRLLGE